MSPLLVGTAGHVDHGKTALLRALTGIDCDRLAEEKRRGITLDLGFAHLERDGVEIGFVDVPGHERFLHNALAGLGAVRLVLLVIAADEGVRAQTREHLAIAELLGVPELLVALTKVDLVDTETVELVELEVEELLEAYPLRRRDDLARREPRGRRRSMRSPASSSPAPEVATFIRGLRGTGPASDRPLVRRPRAGGRRDREPGRGRARPGDLLRLEPVGREFGCALSSPMVGRGTGSRRALASPCFSAASSPPRSSAASSWSKPEARSPRAGCWREFACWPTRRRSRAAVKSASISTPASASPGRDRWRRLGSFPEARDWSSSVSPSPGSPPAATVSFCGDRRRPRRSAAARSSTRVGAPAGGPS